MSYMHYWISWYQPGEDVRPLTFPPNAAILGWWNSGWGDSHATLCALVRGESEDDAKANVKKDWPEATTWRFCEEKPHDWRPGDRFVVDKEWMKERLSQ